MEQKFKITDATRLALRSVRQFRKAHDTMSGGFTIGIEECALNASTYKEVDEAYEHFWAMLAKAVGEMVCGNYEFNNEI